MIPLPPFVPTRQKVMLLGIEIGTCRNFTKSGRDVIIAQDFRPLEETECDFPSADQFTVDYNSGMIYGEGTLKNHGKHICTTVYSIQIREYIWKLHSRQKKKKTIQVEVQIIGVYAGQAETVNWDRVGTFVFENFIPSNWMKEIIPPSAFLTVSYISRKIDCQNETGNNVLSIEFRTFLAKIEKQYIINGNNRRR